LARFIFAVDERPTRRRGRKMSKFSIKFPGVNDVQIEALDMHIALWLALQNLEITNLDTEEVWKINEGFKLGPKERNA
jgi:hypothetical protein